MSAVRAIHSYRSRIDTTARIHVNLVAFGCAWSSAGVPLHEVLRRLAKGGASNLEVFDLSANELGGTISSDIEMFTKLKTLKLSMMGLDGKIRRTQHTSIVCLLTLPLFCRSIAQAARQPRQFEGARLGAQWLHRYDCMSQHGNSNTYMRCKFCWHFHFCAGELPKELGDLINLTWLDVSSNSIGGKLYVPCYNRVLVHMTEFCACTQ